MTLQINLTEQKELWHPGDVVQGTVVLNPLGKLDAHSVKLLFEGCVKSKITERHGEHKSTYSTRIILFQQHLTIPQVRATHTSRQELPFMFSIPIDCSNAVFPSQLVRPGPTNFNCDPKQPLPPTINIFNDKYVGSTHTCYVRYYIKAEVCCSTSRQSNLKSELDLKIMPYREERYRIHEPSFRTVRRNVVTTSIRLDPEVGDRELTFKEHLKSSFGSESIPSVKHLIIVKMPESAFLREAIPIFVSLSFVQDSTTTQPPLIVLKDFKLEGLFHTSQRSHQTESFSRTPKFESWKSGETIGSWIGTAHIGDMLDLRSLDRNMGTKWSAVPNFSTFTLARSYALKLTLTIECARKRSKVVILADGTRFERLSPYIRPVTDAEGLPEYATESPPEEPPPTYSEAMNE